jgi:hypothetical protein
LTLTSTLTSSVQVNVDVNGGVHVHVQVKVNVRVKVNVNVGGWSYPSKADIPVTSWPTTRVWISCVPSYVYTDSRFSMCRPH